jgi:DNA-binding CsgD family transcriptional regulator
VRAELTAEERECFREGYVTQPMILFDRRAVILDGPPVDGDERSTWLVTGPDLVFAAGSLFDMSWRSGRPVAIPPRPAVALTDRQRQMVPLLLAGRSEVAISRRLGVAERTISYEVRALMETLGASGRVDLGYRLRQLEEPVADSRKPGSDGDHGTPG